MNITSRKDTICTIRDRTPHPSHSLIQIEEEEKEILGVAVDVREGKREGKRREGGKRRE